MSAGNGWYLGDVPRERLEEMAVRAIIEVRNLRRREQSNTYFQAIGAGFAIGAFVATAGFLFGASFG
jgi:hypothetical protein